LTSERCRRGTSRQQTAPLGPMLPLVCRRRVSDVDGALADSAPRSGVALGVSLTSGRCRRGTSRQQTLPRGPVLPLVCRRRARHHAVSDVHIKPVRRNLSSRSIEHNVCALRDAALCDAALCATPRCAQITSFVSRHDERATPCTTSRRQPVLRFTDHTQSGQRYPLPVIALLPS